jgi:hypothetical protein
VSARTRTPLGPIPDVLDTYLSEAAFFYERRCAELCAADGTREAAAAADARLELQMDGLVTAGRVAFQLFADRLTVTDRPGEVFAATLLCMRLPEIAPKEALEEALAGPSSQRAAQVDALRFLVGPNGEDWLRHFLSGAPGARMAVLRASVTHPGLQTAVAPLVGDADPLVSLQAQCTLAAMGVAGLPPVSLERHLQWDRPEETALALELLLRFDPEAAAAACRRIDPDADLALLQRALDLLALSGARDAVEHIRRTIAQRPEIAAAGWVALGMAGEIGAVDALLARLDAPWDLPEQQAELEALCQAAVLLTGARIPPRFDVFDFQPEELDRFQSDARAVWETGVAGRRPGAGLWRRGELLTPATLLRDLVAPGHPRRDLCKLQMDVRFGCRIPFDDRAPLPRQEAALTPLRAWALGYG